MASETEPIDARRHSNHTGSRLSNDELRRARMSTVVTDEQIRQPAETVTA